MNAPEEKDPFGQYLARMAGDLTPVVDAGAMAGSAIRHERRRRVVLTVAACLGVLVAISGAMGAAGTVYANRQDPLPASSVSASATHSPSAAAAAQGEKSSEDDEPVADDEPVRYVATGDGELPVMPGVEHGVTEGGAAPYIFGGLWYEVPPGGWTAIGEVWAGGKIGWASPDSELANERFDETLDPTLTIDDVVTDLELRNVFDVSGWTVPDRDSGAMTLEIEGADLVVIEPFKVVTDETGTKVRPVKTRIRSGGEGWIIESRFPADDDGDEMLRNFLGNLWLDEFGEPEWYEPMFTQPEIGKIEHAIPAGWNEATTGGLSYAYPERWTAKPREEATFGDLVEIASDEVVANMPDAVDPDVRWNGYVESGDPGANFWPGWVNMGLEGTSEIEVPGADYAVVQITEGPFYADESLRSLTVDVFLHKEGNGNHSKAVLNFPGGKEGMKLVRQFLGTLSYES